MPYFYRPQKIFAAPIDRPHNVRVDSLHGHHRDGRRASAIRGRRETTMTTSSATTVASIYDDETAVRLTMGLQTADVCDEAIIIARQIATARGQAVLLEDSDGWWRVHPTGETDAIDATEARSMGLTSAEDGE
jgi:hypothetical protein